MIHLAGPILLVAVLAGAGAYGVIARRNAVLVLIGIELLLNAGNLLLVTFGSATTDALWSGQVLALFVITVAAAEVGIALALVLAMFRARGSIDLAERASAEPEADDPAPQPTSAAPERAEREEVDETV
ncbi:MAG TPA: NADH-quinone oxidoreductase subunit NuoK [Segeticoccus sp.]|nr:NADH-quinone oxidoreductase subunit NuoK [Segeticoccus sp.]